MHRGKQYYIDSYLKETYAEIAGVKPGNKDVWLRFDRTIFYPGGGGQLPDRGMINTLAVSEIREENGHIWHKVTGSVEWKAGQIVRQQLDWPRRYYNMQQHSGQHLLSRLMETYDLRTISVHLGEEYTLIEVEGPFPDEQQLLDMEKQANMLLREARPLLVHEVSRKEINRFPLRKPPGAWQQIRVVEIKDYDYSACGGTHVKNTAEIGYIKWLGIEKIRGHARIKWLIGQKADKYLSKMFFSMQQVKSELRCEPEQFAERITVIKNELRNLRKENDVYKRSHLRLRARELYEARKNSAHIIVAQLREEEVNYLNELTKILASEYKQTAFLFCKDRFCLISPDAQHLDTRVFLNDYRETLRIRGGGPAGFVQGVIDKPDLEMITECMKVAINK